MSYKRLADALSERYFSPTCSHCNSSETTENRVPPFGGSGTANPIVSGVGPQAPIVTNEAGGKQSACEYSLVDSFPHRAVLDVARIVKEGLKKYEADNWRKISRRDHINHALVHLFAMLADDVQDDHLGHAACRILMALETE